MYSFQVEKRTYNPNTAKEYIGIVKMRARSSMMAITNHTPFHACFIMLPKLVILFAFHILPFVLIFATKFPLLNVSEILVISVMVSIVIRKVLMVVSFRIEFLFRIYTKLTAMRYAFIMDTDEINVIMDIAEYQSGFPGFTCHIHG